jgi:nucleotide-binding universal stress UspA family protein
MTTKNSSQKPLVVGVDGSHDSQRAIRYAVHLAHRRHAPIRLVHSAKQYVPMAPMLPLLPDWSSTEVGSHVLSTAAEQVVDFGGGDIDVETVLSEQARVEALLRNSEDGQAIVIGTRGTSLGRVLTGATSTAVAAQSSVPVHCVGELWHPERITGRVIVGLDGSYASESVLGQAFFEADSRDAELVVVHAWRPSDFYDHAIGTHSINFETDWEAASRRNVAEIVAGYADKYPDVKVELHLEYDWPALVLKRLSEHVDLAVLGRRGLGGAFGLSLGSIARTMLRVSHCPVVVVPVADPE